MTADQHAELERNVLSAIYAFDDTQLTFLLETFGFNPDRPLSVGGGIPPLHAALDAEVDRGIGEAGYLPSGKCIDVLLSYGANPHAMYVGQNVIEKVGDHEGLRRIRAILVRHGYIGR